MDQIINVPLYRPSILNEASDALNKCFLSGWWGYGKACKELENKFTNIRGGWALATSSCTSALFIVAKLLEYTPNAEVIVPANTWVSSAMAFLNAGFTIKIADISSTDLMSNIKTIKPLITKNTKAVVVVHLYGQKANTKEISEYCKSNNLILIEDCAHRIDIESIPLADYCCYSFNVVKEIPCGEGGLIWSNRMAQEKIAQSISYLGMESNTWQRTSKNKQLDLIFSSTIGLKLQLNDLGASIANAMFEFKDKAKKKRKRIFQIYNENLKELIPEITLLNRKANDSYLMYIIILNGINREILREQMAEDGISTSIHYPSLSHHPLINSSVTPIANLYSENILTLPCFPDLSNTEQFAVINSLKRFLQNR